MSEVPRRKVLQAMGAAGVGAASTATISGVTAMNSGSCPSCPAGTALLGKYEWDGQKFAYQAGECNAVGFTSVTKNSGDPTSVKFDSELFFQSLRVKTSDDSGDYCDSLTRGDVRTDEPGKDGSYRGEVGVDDPEVDGGDAIDYIAFCSAACIQVDFVFGHPITDLGPEETDDGFYSARKIVHDWGNTYTQETSGTQAHTETRNGCTVDTEPISIDFANNEASVTFTLDGSDCTLSLVSYVAPCPTGFTSETADRQYAFDKMVESSISGSGDEYTFTVELPEARDIDGVCDSDGGSGFL